MRGGESALGKGFEMIALDVFAVALGLWLAWALFFTEPEWD